EGHEVGNHTFFHPNLARLSDEEIRLELNATQRAIQAITGKSTLYFRPPYIAGAGPREVGDVRPMLLAQAMGYITVSQEMDPRDYEGVSADTMLDRIE